MYSFGKGPYYVEFKVSIDGSSKWFTIETAPNDAMPHAVYYFLDMVDKKTWDNTVFVHNEDRILSSVLASPEGEDKKHLVENTLAFPEYSDSFPHEKYTFGFSNLGPEFYLNFNDNNEARGPGGKDVNPDGAVLLDADPCFARVVIGGDSIKLMKKKSDEHKGEEARVFTTIQTVKRINLSPQRRKEIGTPVL